MVENYYEKMTLNLSLQPLMGMILPDFAGRKRASRSAALKIAVSASLGLAAGPFAALTHSASATDGQPASPSADVASPSGKVARYLDAVFASRDHNGDGRLSEVEWKHMKGEPRTIDQDQDGVITRAEFRTHVLAYGRARAPAIDLPSPDAGPSPAVRSPTAPVEGDVSAATDDAAATASDPDPAADPSAAPSSAPESRITRFTVRPSRGLGSLPGWFLNRDNDGDGQLTLREYIGEAQGNSREFERLDRNGDGVVTPRELRSAGDDQR